MAVVLLMLNACTSGLSTDRKPAYGTAITGVVEPLVGLLAREDGRGEPLLAFDFSPGFSFSLLHKAHAASGCASSDVQLKLRLLSPLTGSPEAEPVRTVSVAVDGSFEIPDPDALGVRVGDQVNSLIEVSGCMPGMVHSRLVTDYVEQEVSSASSLIASILDLDLAAKRKVQSLPPKELDEFVRTFRSRLGNVVKVSDAFAALQNDAELAQKFESLFQMPVSTLKVSAPKIELLTLPRTAKEKETQAYFVSASHWDPEYSKVFLWKLDDAVVSSSASFNYTPGANAQGSHTLTLYIGRNNGTGGIDLSKPYLQRSSTIEVEDTYPATALSFSEASASAYVNSANVTLALSTGAGGSSCETFTALALTENRLNPPKSADQFSITCTSAGTQSLSYSFVTPGDGTKSLALWAIDASGSVSSAPTTLSLVLDTLAPAASITTPSAVGGGQSVGVSFVASDALSGLASLKLQYASDGTTFSDVADLGLADTSYAWSVPSSVNTTTARLRIRATDRAGNVTLAQTGSFTIDSAGPSAPSVSLASSSLTNSSSVTLTASSCADTPYVLVSEDATPPSRTDSGWQSCVTTPAAIAYTLSGSTEGSRTLKVWSKDAVGNVSSTATSVTLTYDVTAPVLSITTPSSLRGGQTSSVSFTLTEAHATSANSFAVEFYNGTAWSSIGSVASTSGSLSAQSFTLASYTVPSGDTSSAKVRVSYTDAAGNSRTQESSGFVLDSTAPVVGSVSINGGQTFSGTTLVTVNVSVSESVSPPVQIRIAETSVASCHAAAGNGTYQAWTSSSQNFSYTISSTDGQKKLCVWARDAVGNESSFASAPNGTAGVDYDTIELQIGNPPIISSFTARNAATPSTPTKFTSTSDTVSIDYSITDTEGLVDDPVSFAYTTDNSTWRDCTTRLSITTASNITWVGGAAGGQTSKSGTYTGCTAPATTYFRLRATARDSAGNTSISAFSAVMNTGGWSIYAGTPDDGIGGSAKAVRLNGIQSGAQMIAVNPLNNDVYAVSNQVGVLKISAKTGVVTNFLPHGALNLPDSGTFDPSTHRMIVGAGTRLLFDNAGYLYVTNAQQSGIGISYIVHQINPNVSPMTISKYVGGGTDVDGTTDPFETFLTGSMAFDEDNSLYFWTLCVPGTNLRNTGLARILKVTQDPVTRSAGTVSVVAGNCASNAAPVSGQSALAQPLGNQIYPDIGGLAVWDHGNKIYFGAYGVATYKILNGAIYTTGIPSLINAISYNRHTSKLMYASGKAVYEATPSTSGANGESTAVLVRSDGTAAGCTADNVSTANTCVSVDNSVEVTPQGTILFVDGPSVNSIRPYRIRYIDSASKVQTFAGTLPFFGDGLTAGLARGGFAGIFYKKASLGTAAALTAFPEGLYFVDQSGPSFGHIDPSTRVVTTLLGNQQGAGLITNGGTISKDMTMGPGYGYVNGRILTFDDQGLPWFGSSQSLYSIAADKTVTLRTTASPTKAFYTKVSASDTIANTALGFAGGEWNLQVIDDLAFIGGAYYSADFPYDPQIALFNYSSSAKGGIAAGTAQRIMGQMSITGSPGYSADSSADPVAVASKTFSPVCRTQGQCRMYYHAATDRLYFSEQYRVRYISNPLNPSSSTLTTLFSLNSTSNFIYNMIVSEDGTKLFYIRSDGKLYCRNLSGSDAQCTDSTALNPSAGAMTFAVGTNGGPNQMTWKDANTLLISDYKGQIFQYVFTPSP